MALGKVVSNLDNLGNVIAYALGFACGNYIGITIENRIALGKQAAQVVVKEDQNEDLVEHLRENGFGVTVINAEGREGHRKVLHIVFNRKDLDKLKKLFMILKKRLLLLSIILIL